MALLSRTRSGVGGSEPSRGLACEFERKYRLVVLCPSYGMLPQSLPEFTRSTDVKVILSITEQVNAFLRQSRLVVPAVS
jgi:hypothetical protein